MFLDIGVGIILAILVSKFSGISLEASFVWSGIGFALLPDIDVLLEIILFRDPKLLRGGFDSIFHREWFHFPLLYLPIAGVVYYFFGPALASLFILGEYAHFLHDSVGPGWGIKWLAPFSRNNYKFFSEKDGTVSRHFFIRWTPLELAEALKKYHNPYWFRDQYLRFNLQLVVELAVFVIALIILFLIFN